MGEVKQSLEDKLMSLRGPAMPRDVESRIRTRLMGEAAERPAARRPAVKPWRFVARPSLVQLALLLVLAGAACWVLRSEVAPVLRAAWERAHCLIEPGTKPQ